MLPSLPNPYRDRALLQALPGTRLIDGLYDIYGMKFDDGQRLDRIWTVEGAYVPSNRLGVRFKVRDEEGFISFVNQRDFEVMAGYWSPGDWCLWLEDDYLAPDSRQWIGLCLDDVDREDDLLDREMALRQTSSDGLLTPGISISRLLHSSGRDTEELLELYHDVDPDTGVSPCVDLHHLEWRWRRVQEVRHDAKGRRPQHRR